MLCFHGKVRLIQAHTGRHTHHKCGQYDPTWTHIPIQFSVYEIKRFQRPGKPDAMVHAAEMLATGLDFARIDLYLDEKRVVKFGEITFDRWLGGWFAVGRAA